MASTEFLSSKVVILEEEPKVPAIAALASAVVLGCGVTERGKIADAQLSTSFDQWVDLWGGFTADADLALASYGFYQNGGLFFWTVRTVHFTDINTPASATAAASTGMLQTAGTADSAGKVTGTNALPVPLEDGDTLDITTELGGPTTATFNGGTGKASTGGAGPYNLSGGETVIVKVGPAATAPTQTLSIGAGFIVTPGSATRAEVAAALNAVINGAKVTDDTTAVKIETDQAGSGARLEIIGGTALGVAPLLDFTVGVYAGTGNVADLANPTASEIEAVVEGAVSNVAVSQESGGEMSIETLTVGASAWVRVEATSTADGKFGFDNTQHTGADATPEDTLKVDGKTPGAFGDKISTVVADATSGTAAEFNFQVLSDGVVTETFPNVTMDDSAANYVEKVVNNANFGSKLIAVTDQGLAYSALLKRPANGTSSTLTGGDDGLTGIVDIDYLGSSAGPTGLHCFDRVSGGRILIVPGKATPAIHQGMLTYAETTRLGSMFCVLDPPEGYTAEQMVTYVETTASLLERSEFGAIYWPRIKIPNPSTAVFGDDDAIAVAPSGHIAGLMARNDGRNGGVYEQPAGTLSNWGVISGMLGVEDDPGGAEEHQVLDEGKRDLIYPKRINPITKLEGTTWHIDGSRTLKSTGNFPSVAERRGAIHIEQTIKAGLIVLKHRPNNKANRALANRIITAFLLREMAKNAFRSTNPDEAFYVNTSDAINTPADEFAGVMNIKLGLAMNKPTEFIPVVVSQDTRAYVESLGV